MSKVINPPPEEHPSYGCVILSRLTCGGGVSLFGSSIRHTNVVRLSVHHADLRRDFNEDSHMAGGTVVAVDFSPVQFAEMIMSAGVGNGVPCTIRRLKGESIPEPRFDSKREQFVNEFREHTDAVAAKFDTLIAEMEGMAGRESVGKKDRHEFLKKLRLLKQDVECDTPFIASQFNEQMDRTVHEAKGEVEAFVTNLVVKTGMEGLRNGRLSLE